LIPKVAVPESVNDFRPITLLNCCLKIITKILANGLRKVVLKIVHKNQYGFLKGRTIQDCLTWAFEYIYQCQTSNKEILILKLDFAKAFDTIDHGAMIKIMRQMGFDTKWLDWISNILASGKSSVLLNGVLGRHFIANGVLDKEILCPL
jgi:retron-type reverse transcriptase